MSTFSPVRITASGRTVHGNYNAKSFLDPIGRNTPEGVEWRLEQLDKAATDLGFESILDAALILAKSEIIMAQKSVTEFARGGGLAKLVEAICRKEVKALNKSKESLEELNSVICEAARAIYLEEWQTLTDVKNNQQLRMPLTRFTSEHIESFSVASLYSGMQSNAPRLFSLFEGMGINESITVTPEGSDYSAYNDEAEQRRRCRHIVMAVFIIASLRSRQINVMQGIMSYFLYANRVPKRVITILHRWGMTVGYSSLLEAVKSMGNDPQSNEEADSSGKSLREKLQSLSKQGIAFEVIFDNCTAAATVRDERLHNKSDFLNYTVGYVLEPAIPRPMFLRADINYGAVASLTVMDFLPSDDDNKTLQSIFGHFIANVLRKYCRKRNVSLPKLDFPIPIIQRIDPKIQPKIHVLPTYDLDESRIDDMIEILYRISKDVGLSDAQIQNNIVAYGGDYLTTINERYNSLNY